MAMMKKNLFLGMLCGFFALVFTERRLGIGSAAFGGY
jgi:hypothetical protein